MPLRQHADLQLGMPLFERVRGKLYPTPEAHRLFVETEKLHRDLQGIRRLAASLMFQAGFQGISTEWWHYDCSDRSVVRQTSRRVLYPPFACLS